MCGRLTLITTIEQIKKHFMLPYNSGAVITPRYNIAPGQLLLIYKNNNLEFLPWGIKLQYKNSNSNLIINAKLETVLEKKLFSYSFKKQRCVVIGSGFFEWRSLNNKKIPYYVQMKNHNLLGFGGIIVNNQCVILTTTGDQRFKEYFHGRFPVIITPSHYAAWLNPKTSIESLITSENQVKQSDFVIYPVSSQVNHVKLDDKSFIQALT